MSLTWKDLVSTLGAAFVGAIVYARLKGIEVPFPDNIRFGIIIFLVAGIAMCALGSGDFTQPKSVYMLFTSVLGVLALFSGIAGLITGNRTLFYLLAGDILFLWFISTLRHILVR